MPDAGPDSRRAAPAPWEERMDARCHLCGRSRDEVELVPLALVRPAILDAARAAGTEWPAAGFLCTDDLNRLRERHVQELLESEKGDLTELESSVLRSLARHEILSRDVDSEFVEDLSTGERMADRIATFGGSWRFILIFALVIAVWVAVNSVALLRRPFDPYPYILLNLALSCLAAIQAPVIMMSQNRQEARDRLRAKHDYQVNLKAELEIRHLHQKVDHLLSRQWERLVEIQRVQLDIMEDLRGRA